MIPSVSPVWITEPALATGCAAAPAGAGGLAPVVPQGYFLLEAVKTLHATA